MSQRKLRVGMVGGGGPANFFGGPHRRAILMDNSAELTAGALRSKPEESLESARELFFARGYPDWQAMIKGEAALPEARADRLRDDRHPQRRALRPGRGRRDRRDRRALREAADDHARRGPPAARDGRRAQDPVRRRLHLHRLPDGHARPRAGPRRRHRRGPQGRGLVSRRAGWPPSSRPRARSRRRGGSTRARRAPRAAAATSAPTPTSSSGSSPAGRPPGSAAASRRSSRAAPSTTTSPSWPSSTTAAIATIAASQITIGAQNDNGFRISGTTGTLEWSITDHTVLKHYDGGQPLRLYRQGAEYGYFPGSIKPYLRLPSGHPEGFHEALGQPAPHPRVDHPRRAGARPCPTPFEHPGIVDGVAGMAFVEAAVASSNQDGAWVEVPKIG